MITVSEEDLKAIAPYDDSQFREAMKRITSGPAFPRLVARYYPGMPVERAREKALGLRTIDQFQTEVISLVIHELQKRTTRGVKLSWDEALPKDGQYLFISNHRDIILDPAVFTRAIHADGYRTPQICLGDNLLTDSTVTDLIKMNKGITVKRNLGQRELLHWSFVLSEWIRRQITRGHDSIWIAQREGRAKDGHDVTQSGVLKMLALTGEGSFAQRLRNLHIVPVAISYEYDPSDLEKACELYSLKKTGNSQKKPGEDLAAIDRGINAFKGGVDIRVGEEITALLGDVEKLPKKNDQASFVATLIDERIRSQYHNWPSNYIAHDLLNGKNEIGTHYSEEERAEFMDRLEKQLAELPSSADRDGVRLEILKMYAASVQGF